MSGVYKVERVLGKKGVCSARARARAARARHGVSEESFLRARARAARARARADLTLTLTLTLLARGAPRTLITLRTPFKANLHLYKVASPG